MSSSHRVGHVIATALAAVAVASAPASASVFTPGALTQASVLNPLAGCPPDAGGANFPNAEVEPFLGVNPRNDGNLIGVYQQDRYENGGSKGSTAAVAPRTRRMETAHGSAPSPHRWWLPVDRR